MYFSVMNGNEYKLRLQQTPLKYKVLKVLAIKKYVKMYLVSTPQFRTQFSWGFFLQKMRASSII